MATTFWSLSVTRTGFSPPSTHFFAQAACAALAPFAAHLESLIQPSQLFSFGLAIASMLHSNSPIMTKAVFFIAILLSASRCGLRQKPSASWISFDTNFDTNMDVFLIAKLRRFAGHKYSAGREEMCT